MPCTDRFLYTVQLGRNYPFTDLNGVGKIRQAITAAIDQTARRFQIVVRESKPDCSLFIFQKTSQKLGRDLWVIRKVGLCNQRGTNSYAGAVFCGFVSPRQLHNTSDLE